MLIMNADTITAVSAATVAVIGAVTALIIALRQLTQTIMTELQKSRAELAKNTKVTEETHVMINSQRDDMVAQQTRSDNALRQHHIDIPSNPAARVQASGSAVMETPPAQEHP